jgi:hypothetical protein
MVASSKNGSTRIYTMIDPPARENALVIARAFQGVKY